MDLCQKKVDIYMPKAIKTIRDLIPNEITKLYERFPFDICAQPYLLKQLKKYGIQKNRIAFDECFDVTMIGYIYSIHRCAYMKYSHVENYIKHMVKCCVTIGLVLANKEIYSMNRENIRTVCLDEEKNKNRF